MSFFLTVIKTLSALMTDYLLVSALMGTGIYLSLKTRFIQIRCFSEGIKNTFRGIFRREKTQGISPFAALTASLAAQLGTGNIVGAGAAVITGGPGAVFWMWISAFFGMATAYSEAFLAQKTKRKNPDGSCFGGAAYYILYAFRGKRGKFLSLLFSFFATVALGFTGTAVQANSISSAVKEATGIPLMLTGILITASAGIILSRGNRTITAITEKTIPVLTVFYTAICLGVIIININLLVPALSAVFRYAFTPCAVMGGINGITVKTAMVTGIKRGLFTNEAGMGSTASVHALSNAESAHFQGTLGMTGVFIDTFVMMSVTVFAVLTVFMRYGTDSISHISGSEAVTLALSELLGKPMAALFIAAAILFFAFSSILGWHISGKVSCLYLFGKKSEGLFFLSSLCFIFIGSCIPSELAWRITDVFNGFMVLTNIPSLIKTVGEVSRESSFNIKN